MTVGRGANSIFGTLREGQRDDSPLDSLARTSVRRDAAGFIARIRAGDELGSLLLRARAAGDVSADVVSEAERLRDHFQALNAAMADDLRDRIAGARITRAGLLATFRKYASNARSSDTDNVPYDDLDALVAMICRTADAAGDLGEAGDADMVPWQPTPARLVLSLIDAMQLTEHDVFVDIGCGLGTVAILVALLTAARAEGIERDPGLAAHAVAAARGLRLQSVRFAHQDARQWDLSVGTIFYVFTPFTGATLREVFGRLNEEGGRRMIRLCLYGPHLREAMASMTAFSPAGECAGGAISLYRSHPG